MPAAETRVLPPAPAQNRVMTWRTFTLPTAGCGGSASVDAACGDGFGQPVNRPPPSAQLSELLADAIDLCVGQARVHGQGDDSLESAVRRREAHRQVVPEKASDVRLVVQGNEVDRAVDATLGELADSLVAGDAEPGLELHHVQVP